MEEALPELGILGGGMGESSWPGGQHGHNLPTHLCHKQEHHLYGERWGPLDAQLLGGAAEQLGVKAAAFLGQADTFTPGSRGFCGDGQACHPNVWTGGLASNRESLLL